MPAEKAITIPGSLIGGYQPHVANQETSDETARGKGQKRLHPHRGGATIGVLGWKYQQYLINSATRTFISACLAGTNQPG